jgi:hypothetical protein
MTTFNQLYESILLETASILYHVTTTKNASKIKKKGIVPMQPTNWVNGSGDRYGEGEIYAFDHIEDALRWAAKMDWDFNKKMGGGDISIIKFKNDGDWDVDTNDPLSQAANKGKWYKKMEMVPANKIVKIIKLEQSMLPLLSNFEKEVKPKDVGI